MKKKISWSIFKVLICVVAVTTCVAGVGATVWAIARNHYKYNAGFNVNISGGRYVNATIKGSSYSAGSDEVQESLSAISFDDERADEEITLEFEDPITVNNDEQSAKLYFEVKNNSTYSDNSDLIIKVNDINNTVDDFMTIWYYSINGTNFTAKVDDYLVVHKGGTIYLELRMLATQDFYGSQTFEGSIDIDMYSEAESASLTGFEYEYNYSCTEDNKLQKARVCPTCQHIGEWQTMDESEYVIMTDGLQFEGYDISNKVIYIKKDLYVENTQGMVFDHGMENIVITSDGEDYDISISVSALSQNNSKYENIKIQNINFVSPEADRSFVDISNADNGGTYKHSIKNFTVQNCHFTSEAHGSASGVRIGVKAENIVVKNCEFACIGSAGVEITKGVNNLKVVNCTSYQSGVVASISGHSSGRAVSGKIIIANNCAHEASGILSIDAVQDASVLIVNNRIERVVYSTYIFASDLNNTTLTFYDARWYEFGEGFDSGEVYNIDNLKKYYETNGQIEILTPESVE